MRSSALAVLGGGFLPSSRVGAAHPSSVDPRPRQPYQMQLSALTWLSRDAMHWKGLLPKWHQVVGISGGKHPGIWGWDILGLQWCLGPEPVLQMSCPADPGQSVCPVLLQGKQAAFPGAQGGHGSHNVLSSKVQAPFQQRDGEPVKRQSLHPN